MAGQQGPASWMRGFAAIATGFAGLERMVGYPETGVTTGMLPFGLGDTTMAIQGFIGALAALLHRQRTGEGQFVDVSQIESTTATLGEALLDYQLNGRVAGVQGNRHPVFAPHGLYATAGDDRWLAIAVRDTREWLALCEVAGWDRWAIDEQLLHGPGRKEREQEIEAALVAWCSTQDRDEAAAMLCESGVPAAPLLEATERDTHPALTSRGFSVPHDFEGHAACDIYATPWLFSATQPIVTRPAPLLGEHNDYVYRELLALSDAEITQLKAEGVLE
jgi:crotonobetainyl-CoA:carnitine CoA-transferase CaiB-like acyl-CoA transferase